MLAHSELRNELIRFLSDELSLDNFEDWFVQNSWNIHKSPDLVGQRLAYAVELRLAEHDSGHLPERDLRRELGELVKSYSVNLSQVPASVSYDSAVNFSRYLWPVPSSGKPLVVAYELQVPD